MGLVAKALTFEFRLVAFRKTNPSIAYLTFAGRITFRTLGMPDSNSRCSELVTVDTFGEICGRSGCNIFTLGTTLTLLQPPHYSTMSSKLTYLLDISNTNLIML
jgi:hypothetical protein